MIFSIILLAFISFGFPAHANRIKDVGQFEGLRVNQLTGYGIVVGLAGTGDDSLPYSTEGARGTLARFGMTLPPGVSPSLKNSAAVLVTAELPPFAKPGQRLDVTVSAIGQAKSLRGGTLILMPLQGANGQIYAMAQGNLAVSGLGVDAADGSKSLINTPSVGRIAAGATVERSVPNNLTSKELLTFNLHRADPTTAMRVAKAINEGLGIDVARARDAISIDIFGAKNGAERITLMSKIENLPITPGRAKALVVVNARTGTVVINDAVRILPAAVSHGKLTVRIKEAPRVVQPAPFSEGETAIEEQSEIEIEGRESPLFQIERGASLSEIVETMNAIGTSPSDLVSILEALKQAGAMSAELVIQ